VRDEPEPSFETAEAVRGQNSPAETTRVGLGRSARPEVRYGPPHVPARGAGGRAASWSRPDPSPRPRRSAGPHHRGPHPPRPPSGRLRRPGRDYPEHRHPVGARAPPAAGRRTRAHRGRGRRDRGLAAAGRERTATAGAPRSGARGGDRAAAGRVAGAEAAGARAAGAARASRRWWRTSTPAVVNAD
jgi:hypothetical protein